jgi:15-cis-phytoene synthase
MDTNEYCQQKIAPPGSPLYYSVLKLNPEQRVAIIAIAVFYQEINDILFKTQDSVLAETKLNWWRLEISKVSLGKPDHPIALALQAVLKHFPISSQLLVDLIDGMAETLHAHVFAKFEDVTIHIMRTAGLRELLISDIMRQNKPHQEEIIYQFALTLQLAEYIQHLRLYIVHGFIPFAEDEMKKYQVTVAMLEKLETTKEIQALLQYQKHKAELAYQKAYAALSPADRLANMSVIIRCEIALVNLNMIASSQFKVLEHLISLTPLRRWWIAYKTYRKLRKLS